MRTAAGADFQCAQLSGTPGAAANQMAVSASVTAMSSADTSLPGEIATAGGGLVRKVVVYGHTAGTNTYTLTGVFTANGSDALPVTLGKYGVLNASSGGVLFVENLLSPTATLSAAGDNVTITETVTV